MLLLLCTSVFLLVTSSILYLIHGIQPSPYMDEIFHVPQTIQYCNDNWTSWDPMITTLPGLYVTANGLVRLVSLATGQPLLVVCSTLWLRSVNVLLSTATCYLLMKISATIGEAGSKRKGSLGGDHLLGFVVSFFPVLYFFSFLYYTDVLSTFMVLLTYWLSCRDRHLLAAVSGAFSIFCRQTNVVWVGFAAATAALRVLHQRSSKFSQVSEKASSLLHLVPEAIRNLPALLAVLWPYVPVVLGFAAFVVHNNGIVVGDRSHHQVSFHAAQMCYFIMFTAVFSTPQLIHPEIVRATLLNLWQLLKQPILLLFLSSGIFAMMIKGSYVHKYLLADNRHYTFYLWRKFLAAPSQRAMLVLVCLLALLALFSALRNSHCVSKRPTWLLVFTLATAAVCVPQQLLELRYFIVPYLLVRLHMARSPLWCLAMEFILYAAVNVATVYLFMYKPFQWPSGDTLQRFMW